jgi:glycosyltransferase involved in cell wall biosynthesis
MKTDAVDILLAAYNGETFIASQLDSLLAQNYKGIHIIIRDDLSTDNTLKILEEYASRFPAVITLIPSKQQLGVKGNFSCLMENSSADYMMFADQDDIWNACKVAKTLAAMKALERNHPEGTPLLVHTDAKVADKDLCILSDSFWGYSGINIKRAHSLNRLLMQNVVTGCSMMINRSLLVLAIPIPEACVMHDWWLALVAASLGKIDALAEPTMLYRQHGKNTIGAQKFLSWNYIKLGLHKLRKPEAAKQAQVKELLRRHSECLSEGQIALLKDYQELPQAMLPKKAFLIFKHGFFKVGLMRNFVNILFKRQ